LPKNHKYTNTKKGYHFSELFAQLNGLLEKITTWRLNILHYRFEIRDKTISSSVKMFWVYRLKTEQSASLNTIFYDWGEFFSWFHA